MTEFLHLMVLAVVQGLTEFLPISSSGHLVLTQVVLGSSQGDLFVEVALHVGTLFSILAVYRAEVRRLLRLDRPALLYVAALAVGTIPAVLVGLLLRQAVEVLYGSTSNVALGLLLTAVLLFATRHRLVGGHRTGPWEPAAPTFTRAFLVGVAQAVAIIPGVSRSGTTIAAGILTGLPRAEAARFGFLLSVPAVAGAMVLQIAEGDLYARTDLPALAVAVLVSFGVGLLAIRWTTVAVVQAHFWKFGFYCLALGAVVLLWVGR